MIAVIFRLTLSSKCVSLLKCMLFYNPRVSVIFPRSMVTERLLQFGIRAIKRETATSVVYGHRERGFHTRSIGALGSIQKGRQTFVTVRSGECAQGLKTLWSCTRAWESRYVNSRKTREDLRCRSRRKAQPLDLADSCSS
jgi:hypothetical protein